MRSFKISFVVGLDKLSTVVSLLATEASHFEVNETDEVAKPIAREPIKRFQNKPVEEQRCAKILLAAFADGKPKRMETLSAELVKNGFAASSASPCTTHLVKRGKIVRVVPGTYQLAEFAEVNSHHVSQ